MSKILQIKSMSEAYGECLPANVQETLRNHFNEYPTQSSSVACVICPVVQMYELYKASDAIITESEE